MPFPLLRILALFVVLGGCTTSAPVQIAPESAVKSFLPTPKLGDFDPFDWTGRSPASYPVHGIDVSRYQGEIDWNAVQAAGVSFAYLKATEGGDLADPNFRAYRRGARRAGVAWGAYHYFYWCRPAAEQARWFIRHVPRDASALPHVLDMEWNPHSPTCRERPEGRKVRAEARIFLNLLERHYGKRPVLYVTPDFYKDTGIGRLAGTRFWLRSTAGHPSETYPGQPWLIWQYSGTGEVPGIEGPVDLNAFAGAPEAFLSWAGRL